MENNIADIRATDPLDILIFEKGLRIKSVIIDKELDLMVLILTNGKIIKSKISCFKLLRNASQKQLDGWNLISKGVGIHWEELDEDLSLKGFIKDSAINQIIKQLDVLEDTVLV